MLKEFPAVLEEVLAKTNKFEFQKTHLRVFVSSLPEFSNTISAGLNGKKISTFVEL